MNIRPDTWRHCEPSDNHQPYRSFAFLYDQLLGRPMLPRFIRNFELITSRYAVSFDAAADIACGAGHFAGYLRGYGVPVFGTDLSPVMVAMARRNYAGRGIHFMVQDMRCLALPRKVDLLTCNFDALNYLLEPKDLEQTFQAFFLNLNTNGHVLFDAITSMKPQKYTQPSTYRFETPGMISIWQVQRQPAIRLRTVWIQNFLKLHAGYWPVARECHRQRAWPVNIITSHLARHGFTLRGVHTADSGTPERDRNRRVVFLASKT